MTAASAAIGRCLLILVAAAMPAGTALAGEPLRTGHPLGFSVPVPDGAAVEADDRGVLITLGGGMSVRSPARIALSLLRGPDEPPPFPLTLSEQVGGETAWYGVREVTEGSGGTEYDLVVRMPLCGGVIEVRASRQRELGGTPDFDLAWHILAETRCSN